VSFQSRLKGAPWIRPFSDEFYRSLPKQGVKKLAVVCPSFVADCLETLEEVRIRGKEEFVEHGGEDLVLIPSLNSEDLWVKGITQIVQNHHPST
jgi:ferrochelatase